MSHEFFLSSHPLSKEWHPTKNEKLDPSVVKVQSNKSVWWLGDCQHEWEASVQSRTKDNNKCPFCTGRHLLTGFNDLATKYPDLTSQWHPVHNTESPATTLPSSTQTVWWLGDCGHEWTAKVNARTKNRNPSGCPVCRNVLIVAGINDLQTSYPRIAERWHPSKNSLTCEQVSAGSSKVVWWLGDCHHEWESAVKYMTKNNAKCPFCSNSKTFSGLNDLETLKPELAALWHSSKNPFSPDVTPAYSNKKAWFECEKGHEWQEVISWASSKCGFCSGLKIIPGENDLLTTHPQLAAEWHPTKNESITPSNITSSTTGKRWWRCSNNHEWEAPLQRRVQGHGCPVCSGQRVDVGKNDLASLRPELAVEWHLTKNNLSASDVKVGSGKKVWWHCKNNHEWEAKIADRTRLDGKANGCPSCFKKSSQLERDLLLWLEAQNSEFEIESNTRKVIFPYELDIYIPELSIAIEFNGLYWHDERHKTRNYHYNKWDACRKKNIQLLQIWEDDWRENSDVIKKMLAHKLRLSQQEKVSARNTVVTPLTYSETSQFLNENHVQGAISGSYLFGLKMKGSQQLVAVLVAKWTSIKRDELTILRFATAKNVRGGFTKLLKHLENTVVGLQRVITFSDNCVSDGALYQHHGFIQDKNLAPDYKYVVGNKRTHKFRYRLERFEKDPNLKWQAGLTEKELADINGLYRIWDAGKIRWKKIVSSGR